LRNFLLSRFLRQALGFVFYISSDFAIAMIGSVQNLMAKGVVMYNKGNHLMSNSIIKTKIHAPSLRRNVE
jgi:hypothetical protein